MIRTWDAPTPAALPCTGNRVSPWRTSDASANFCSSFVAHVDAGYLRRCVAVLCEAMPRTASLGAARRTSAPLEATYCDVHRIGKWSTPYSQNKLFHTRGYITQPEAVSRWKECAAVCRRRQKVCVWPRALRVKYGIQRVHAMRGSTITAAFNHIGFHVNHTLRRARGGGDARACSCRSMLGRETESPKQSLPSLCYVRTQLHITLLPTLSDIGSPVSMVEHQTACF